MMLIDAGVTARRASRGCNPSSTRIRLALGESCRPAPASSSRSAFSRTTTRNPLAASASAAVSPPIPAPATTTVRVTATAGLSGDFVFQHAFRRARLAGGKIGGKTVQRRAIGTDDLVVIAKVEEDVRMVERRVGAHAHELLRADLDYRDAGVVVEVRDDMVGHLVFTLDGNDGRTQSTRRGTRNAAH